MSFAHRSDVSFNSNLCSAPPVRSEIASGLVRWLGDRLASLEAGLTIAWALAPLAIALAAALGAFVAL
jgi:hypothetical protein